MSASAQFIDPRVLDDMDPELRATVEKHFAYGVRRVDVKFATRELDIAKSRFLDVEKLISPAVR